MNRLRRLKQSALESCKNRGHDMMRFCKRRYALHDAESQCRNCSCQVFVETHPAPNSTEICGDAVALDCKERKA